ncbi:putative phage tail protein [Anaerotignum sp.]|uniref:putative phage tail protein n=1 Tax=Anaerotignum sp. TaxID=2039241 RepID=UPI0028B1E269|nr:putative phage tail protein [Anaerotignum sp.]
MDRIESYFPDLLREVREFQKLAEAENPELLFLWDELKLVLDNQFIDTATQIGVARREKMLKISAKATDTLDERKFKLLARYNENIPYTLRALHGQLSMLCGEKGYRLEINYGAFTLNAKLELTNKKNVDVVGEMLERIVPMNMLLKVELLYNQHQLLQKFTHEEMRKYTHLNLREEALGDG